MLQAERLEGEPSSTLSRLNFGIILMGEREG